MRGLFGHRLGTGRSWGWTFVWFLRDRRGLRLGSFRKSPSGRGSFRTMRGIRLIRHVLTFLEYGALERKVVAGEVPVDLAVLLDERAHALHLGIHVVEIVEQQRLGKLGQFGRAELVLAVVADDHVLDQRAEPRRKVRK